MNRWMALLPIFMAPLYQALLVQTMNVYYTILTQVFSAPTSVGNK